MTPYRQLEERFRRIHDLAGAQAMLSWDMQTMMPTGSADVRAEQLGTLEALSHELLTRPEVADWLDASESDGDLDEWQRANVREMRRSWRQSAALDAKLVEELSRVGTQTTMVWRAARPQNDFAMLAPHLTHVLQLVREMGQQLAGQSGSSPYDALLDRFEPGMTTARITSLFAPLRETLPTMIPAVTERQRAAGEPLPLQGPFPVAAQKALGETLMKALGFSFERGRLDVSAHPFCGGVPGDVRITTRYREDDFASALMGVLHETGHALYEMFLPPVWRSQPVGRARSMAIHESQSLLIEMQLCRSDAFLTWAAPRIAAAFDGNGPAWSAANLIRRAQAVEVGLIRVDADEVTYPCHVMMRFDLEQALVGGTLEVNDLPDAWAAGMQSMLGVTPPDNRDGCMQDIHWMDGAFGYFPSYTLGAMTAAQLFDAARRDVPGLDDGLVEGAFLPLTDWLRENVHAQASRFETDALVARATGAPLTADAFLAHLRRRYLDA